MNIFEANYSVSEYIDRHAGNEEMIENRPKQTPIDWRMWDDLFDFFTGYFKHFGDDISGLDDKTFKRMVKTIWRFSAVHTMTESKKYLEENHLSFKEQLRNWADDIRRNNREAMDEIGPFELWNMVMSYSTPA